MRTRFLLFPILALLTTTIFSLHCRGADDVRVWLTRIDDGTRRETNLALNTYGPDQDTGYDLLREMPTIRLTATLTDTITGIRIETGETEQTVLGLGASLTDASAYLLQELRQRNRNLYDYTMERLFSLDAGAGFSYIRLPMGSSDYTATDAYYTYADEPSEDLSTFSIAHDREYIIPIIQDIKRINPDVQLMGSPWSPPAWMKTNNSLLGISRDDKLAGLTNRLKPEYFEIYAEYFIKYVQAYRSEGILINAITLQNEPQADGQSYPSLRLTATDEAALINHVGSRFRQEGITTGIFAHDHNWTVHPGDVDPSGRDVRVDPLEKVSSLFNNEATDPYLAGSAWHGYSGRMDDMARVYETLYTTFPDQAIYFTEITAWRLHGTDPEWLNDIRWGLRNNWLGTFQHKGSVSLEWNLALDQNYGPTLRNDSRGIGLVTIHSDTWNSVKFEREYYAMAHVSKAARPGARYLATTLSGGSLDVAAFRLPSGTTSLVVFNENGEDRAIEIASGGRFFSYVMPARSIATFIWD
ncbi:glycoside hydrolase family 30 beta sandwich domain-containing protein [Candidatus Neomarinimicrobiota bacterium]